MSKSNFTTSCTPTQKMGAIGWSFTDVQAEAEHVIFLLNTYGATMMAVVRRAINVIHYFSDRDMLGVFTEVNAAIPDVQKLIDAVKAEFNL